jgi:membrane-associated phospholipid phosphatase
MIWIGLYLPLLLFHCLAFMVWSSSTFIWENSLLYILHTTATPQIDEIASTLTHFGMKWGVFPVAIGIALILLLQGQWSILRYWVLTFTSSIACCTFAKVLWHRARPQLWESFYPLPSDFSFPSGHATASMTLVVALTLLLWKSRWRFPVLGFGSLFVLIVAWTRLYLGVHYPSDILAGWMIAIAWAVGLHALLHPWQDQDQSTKPSESIRFS